MYLRNNELLYGKKIKNIYFRSKDKEMNNGAYIEFEDGFKKSAATYITAFTGAQLISRPSCNNCQFVSSNRKADFTIGDFWGIDKVFPDFNDGKGISLLTVNTEKATKIFNEIKENMEFNETDLELAFSNNHNCNLPQNKNRAEFFSKIADGSINENNIIKYMNKYSTKPLYRRILGKGKKIVKRLIKS